MCIYEAHLYIKISFNNHQSPQVYEYFISLHERKKIYLCQGK